MNLVVKKKQPRDCLLSELIQDNLTFDYTSIIRTSLRKITTSYTEVAYKNNITESRTTVITTHYART